MFVDEIIQEINRLIADLKEMRDVERDQEKKFLLGTLRNILKYAITSLAIFFCKELQDKKRLNYITKQGNVIEMPVDREFLDRSLRRAVLFDIWGMIEFYFTKKVLNGESLSTKKLVESYYNHSSVPDIINFFRETRNSLHGNGVYNANKQKISIVINKKIYILVPGKEIQFTD